MPEQTWTNNERSLSHTYIVIEHAIYYVLKDKYLEMRNAEVTDKATSICLGLESFLNAGTYKQWP